MWVIEDVRRTAAILLALTGLMVVALGGLAWAPVTEDDWLGAMMRAVLAEQANEGPFWGTVAPLCRTTGDGTRASSQQR